MIAALVFLLGSQLSAADDSDAVKLAKMQRHELGVALDMYYIDCGEYPEKLDALIEKPTNCEKWGPVAYIVKIPVDPWGQPWIYIRKDSKHYEIKCFGADRREGGIGDKKDITFKQTAPVLKKR